MGRLTRICMLTVLMALGGCSASWHSIHHLDNLAPGKSTVIIIDAKQRALVSNWPVFNPDPPSNGTEDVTYRRFCAEPSPDVFSVLGQAFSSGGNFSKSADPTSLNIALQAAFSSNEIGSTIPRTQTINMLREMMYRTCERYLSGAIDPGDFSIIAARDQRIMVSILAIEQLIGAVTPKPVVIAATGKASTGQPLADAVVRIDDARKRYQTEQANVDRLNDSFKQFDSDGKCEKLPKEEGSTPNKDDQTTQTSCKDKKDQIAKAVVDRDQAKNDYDKLTAVVASGAGSASSAEAMAQLLSDHSGSSEAKAVTVTSVTEAVREIVGRSFDRSDETSFFCYRMIGNPKVYKNYLDTISQVYKTNDALKTTTAIQKSKPKDQSLTVKDKNSNTISQDDINIAQDDINIVAQCLRFITAITKENTKKAEEGASKAEEGAVKAKVEAVKATNELDSIKSSHDKARASERAGFEAIIQNDYQAAINNFMDSADSWPDYHNVSEIRDLLKSNKAYLEKNKGPVRLKAWKKVIKIITIQYYWGIPDDILKRLQDTLKTSE